MKRIWAVRDACAWLTALLGLIALPVALAEEKTSLDSSVVEAQKQRIATMRKAAEATVAIFGLDGGGGGSGVIVSADGYALTNYHVSSACGDHMRCGLNDGQVYDAVIVGIDATGDVSLIKLLGRDDFPSAPLADSDTVRVGQWCFAAGNPFVLATNLQPSISLGLVSGVNRYQYPAGTLLEYADCIQTDAAINPGNSGGPLFNMSGEIIGINGRCSFEKRGRVNVGVGYAISANQIKKFLGMLESGRLVDHATLGATVSTDVSANVRVSNILSSSDAYRRGLRYGDEVIALADREVRSTNNFKNILGTLPKDWRVPLVIRRDGKNQTLLVRLDGVHTEKQLIDLVTSEAGDPHGEPKNPSPDDPGKKDTDNEGSEEERADEKNSDKNDPEELGSSKQELESNGHPGRPNKKLVESMLKTRTGFANYYFNQLRTRQFAERVEQLGDFSGFDGQWTLTATLAGETTPAKISLSRDRGELQIGSRAVTADFSAALSDIVAQRRENGLLLGLHGLRQLLQVGPERMGDTIYIGSLPVYVRASTALSDQPLHEMIQSLWFDAKICFYADPSESEVSVVEVFGDTGQDPVELILERYVDVPDSGKLEVAASANGETDEAASGVRFPSRLRLQYGAEPMLVLDIQSIQFEASKDRNDNGAEPPGQLAAPPAGESRSEGEDR